MVYVDNFDEVGKKLNRMKMCHMIADSRDELMAMAEMIGVNKKWIQNSGEQKEHFDISRAKKSLAIKNGATEINMRRLAAMVKTRNLEWYMTPII